MGLEEGWQQLPPMQGLDRCTRQATHLSALAGQDGRPLHSCLPSRGHGLEVGPTAALADLLIRGALCPALEVAALTLW